MSAMAGDSFPSQKRSVTPKMFVFDDVMMLEDEL